VVAVKNKRFGIMASHSGDGLGENLSFVGFQRNFIDFGRGQVRHVVLTCQTAVIEISGS